MNILRRRIHCVQASSALEKKAPHLVQVLQGDRVEARVLQSQAVLVLARVWIKTKGNKGVPREPTRTSKPIEMRRCIYMYLTYAPAYFPVLFRNTAGSRRWSWAWRHSSTARMDEILMRSMKFTIIHSKSPWLALKICADPKWRDPFMQHCIQCPIGCQPFVVLFWANTECHSWIGREPLASGQDFQMHSDK